MYKGKRILALIPARGGSKGIKDKNIKLLADKPLIAYSIEAALKSRYIDRVIVSTDAEAIAEVAQAYGAEVPFMRPEALATDTAKTIEVVMHALETLEADGMSYDYMVLLQPTQPLRQAWHIDEAIEKIMMRQQESLVSVTVVENHPLLMRQIQPDGSVTKLLAQNSTQRRQEFEPYYYVNGSIYINEVSKLTLQTSLNDNLLAYEMDTKYDKDIDEYIDFEIAKLKLQQFKP